MLGNPMQSMPVAVACRCQWLLISSSVLLALAGCSQREPTADAQPQNGKPRTHLSAHSASPLDSLEPSERERMQPTEPTTDRQPQIATHASQPLLSEPVDPIGPHTFLPTLDPIARQPESGLELPTGTLADRSSHPAVSDRLARSAVGQPDPPFNTPQLNLPPGSSLSPRSLSRRFESSDPSRMLSVLPPAASGMPTIPITRLPVTTAIPSASGTELSEPRSPSTPLTASRTARSIEVGSPEVGAAFSMLAESAPTDVANATPRGARLSGPMPSGTEPASGYSKVQVYYATDRQRSHLPLAAYELSGQKTGFMVLSFFSLLCMAFAGMNTLRGKTRSAGAIAILGALSCCLAASLIVFGRTQIEKHGVNYTGDRGQFTRGIAEVTIPDGHQAGVVERPSLLKFEVREDQSKHMVLTSAVELLKDDFQQRISKAIAKSPEHDVLVFIHGYNVSFESALLRTAQIAVDLPFEGVPVCYSWPSQATLTGYPIDVNNADWTVPHLQDFLLELANQTGADSINVIAHSMGNRALTAAMRQISQQPAYDHAVPFDRIVLAAPDVDADYFRRDCAPALVKVANQITLYASSDDQALIASRKVNGYPRAGDSGSNIVIVPGVETVDVSGIDLSLLGHSYYGDNESMLRDLYDVIRARLPAPQRRSLVQRNTGPLIYWQLAQQTGSIHR